MTWHNANIYWLADLSLHCALEASITQLFDIIIMIAACIMSIGWIIPGRDFFFNVHGLGKIQFIFQKSFKIYMISFIP